MKLKLLFSSVHVLEITWLGLLHVVAMGDHTKTGILPCNNYFCRKQSQSLILSYLQVLVFANVRTLNTNFCSCNHSGFRTCIYPHVQIFRTCLNFPRCNIVLVAFIICVSCKPQLSYTSNRWSLLRYVRRS